MVMLVFGWGQDKRAGDFLACDIPFVKEHIDGEGGGETDTLTVTGVTTFEIGAPIRRVEIGAARGVRDRNCRCGGYGGYSRG